MYGNNKGFYIHVSSIYFWKHNRWNKWSKIILLDKQPSMISKNNKSSKVKMHAWKWKKHILFCKTTGLGWLSQQWNCTLGEHVKSSRFTEITLVTKNITTISCISSFLGSQYPFRDSGHYCTRWSRTTDSIQKPKYSLYYSWTILSDAFQPFWQ